jgi:hypothetical protein
MNYEQARQWPGRFLGTISQNPLPFKTNRFHVAIVTDSRDILQISQRIMGDFPGVVDLDCFSLKLEPVGSPHPLREGEAR